MHFQASDCLSTCFQVSGKRDDVLVAIAAKKIYVVRAVKATVYDKEHVTEFDLVKQVPDAHFKLYGDQ